MDISSEMIHSLLPIFLTSSLGVGTATVGLIEGIAEATASITKIFSGTISDYFGKRKLLAGLGYGLAAVTKPLFPLADSVTTVVTARFIDRVGKGIRGAPRDALVGDLAPPDIRGACFGLRQSLDTVGAFLGPLIAIALMWVFQSNIRAVFWVAVIPAFIAVGLLIIGVTEPEIDRAGEKRRFPINVEDLRRLGRAFWLLVLFSTLFQLARFSEAFLVLKASEAGLSAWLIPMTFVLMNLVYAVSAYPAGHASDLFGRGTLLKLSLFVLVFADIALALSGDSLVAIAIGVSLWGLHMGLSQGVLSTMVSEAVPGELRGTAFGIFNLWGGLVTLCASVIAGSLWEGVGSRGTFLAGAAFAAGSIGSLFLVKSYEQQSKA